MSRAPDLADRLRAEAERLDVKGPSPSALASRGRRRKRVRAVVLAISLVAVAGTSLGLGLVVVGDDPTDQLHSFVEPTGPSRQSAPTEERYGDFEPLSRPPAPRSRGGEFAGAGTGSAGTASTGSGEDLGTSDQSGTTSTGSGAGQPSFSAGPPTDPLPSSAAGPRVIKTATLSLEVEDGSLGRSFAEVERLAAEHGGFVSESITRSSPARSGDVTIRVPAAAFEAVVADIKALGEVRFQRVSGVDVTADFIDLQARLRNWEAHERVLVRLMDEAGSIAAALQVQRELQQVRAEIERILGQLRVLRDQTELASISIGINEPGAEPERPGEKNAWQRALDAAGAVLSTMLIGLGYLVPILGVLLILWLGARAVRRRRAD